MLKKIITHFASCVSLCLVLASCESHTSTTEDAFEQEKNRRRTSADSEDIHAQVLINKGQTQALKSGNSIIPQSHKSVAAPKPAPLDPWRVFENSLTMQIASNETLIWQLKVLPNNAKNLKRIGAVEQDNTDLRTRIAEFNLDEKARRDKFMGQINTTLDGIGSTLKDLQASGH